MPQQATGGVQGFCGWRGVAASPGISSPLRDLCFDAQTQGREFLAADSAGAQNAHGTVIFARQDYGRLQTHPTRTAVQAAGTYGPRSCIMAMASVVGLRRPERWPRARPAVQHRRAAVRAPFHGAAPESRTAASRPSPAPECGLRVRAGWSAVRARVYSGGAPAVPGDRTETPRRRRAGGR